MKDILYNEKLFNINAKKINGLELLDNIKDKIILTAFLIRNIVECWIMEMKVWDVVRREVN